MSKETTKEKTTSQELADAIEAIKQKQDLSDADLLASVNELVEAPVAPSMLRIIRHGIKVDVMGAKEGTIAYSTHAGTVVLTAKGML
jgi:hypothetical protein